MLLALVLVWLSEKVLSAKQKFSIFSHSQLAFLSFCLLFFSPFHQLFFFFINFSPAHFSGPSRPPDNIIGIYTQHQRTLRMENKYEYKKNTREGKQFVLGEKKLFSRLFVEEKMKRKKRRKNKDNFYFIFYFFSSEDLQKGWSFQIIKTSKDKSESGYFFEGNFNCWRKKWKNNEKLRRVVLQEKKIVFWRII